jgi:hypothetical protein
MKSRLLRAAPFVDEGRRLRLGERKPHRVQGRAPARKLGVAVTIGPRFACRGIRLPTSGPESS